MLQPSSSEYLFEIPPARTGHVAVSYDKCVLVWGGYKENPGAQASTYYSGSEMWIYSCVSERWWDIIKNFCIMKLVHYKKYLKECYDTIHPPGTSGSTAVIIEDSLYLFGGYGYRGEGCTNRLYKLDLTAFSWELLKPTGTPPIPVDKMVGWQYNDKFYIFGGFGNPDAGPPHDFQFIFYHLLWRGWTNQFFEYDPKKNRWSVPATTGTLPSARAAHAAAVAQGKVYIFGGRHDVFRLNDMHCLDMKTMEWSGKLSMKGTLPVGRSWHSLTALDDRYLVLYGGFSQSNVALSK
ncbi:kelch domain-containing protein 1 [Trichonephila inaurata madagascariensis]|uniref:Kelch domain-containing protein 1 n=1 Tax=Trichonephila inaurata madagascariensis TaxID=2747483 RepID=A0A8X6X3I7_9ARAC|nr:kelch domain-containing protein 1 [Trichonephila inaurata madagascariensis]